MIVKKTSIFPASEETIFQKLQQLDTLRYIAKPYATFEPVQVQETTGIWKVGSTSSYRFRLFGLIPLGIHTIHIEKFDQDIIKSREGNKHVPIWNHDIRLVPLASDKTMYTDQVEIKAGWKTLFVWLWANAFYRHRQRKWIKMLRKEKGLEKHLEKY